MNNSIQTIVKNKHKFNNILITKKKRALNTHTSNLKKITTFLTEFSKIKFV